MATIKSYTDIPQGFKLKEILPFESADMYYNPRPSNEIPYVGNANTALLQVPCWSLAALLDVIPEGLIENYYVPNLQKENGKYSIAYGNEELLCVADNPIDACYKMIIKLKDMKLL